MGNIADIHETSPGFEIADDATPEQRQFLEAFEARALAMPDVYAASLNVYLRLTSPDRLRDGALASVVGAVLAYSSLEPINLQSLYDWHLMLHGEDNAISQLHSFDTSTETTISNSETTRKIQNKLREATRGGARNKYEFTEALRVSRFRHFLGRAAAQALVEIEEAEVSEANGDAA